MSSPTIEAVVFDFGGVIISPITEHITRVAERHGVTTHQLFEVLLGPHDVSTIHHPWHRAERGEIPVADITGLLEPWADAAGITLVGDEIDIIMHSEFVIRDRVIAAINAVRAAGFRTGLLTNSFLEYRSVLESRCDISVFDEVIDSSVVGCRKPEPRIYELTTAAMGCAPEAVLYVDDFIGNIEGALLHGWNAVHVDSEQAVLDAIERFTGVTI